MARSTNISLPVWQCLPQWDLRSLMEPRNLMAPPMMCSTSTSTADPFRRLEGVEDERRRAAAADSLEATLYNQRRRAGLWTPTATGDADGRVWRKSESDRLQLHHPESAKPRGVRVSRTSASSLSILLRSDRLNLDAPSLISARSGSSHQLLDAYRLRQCERDLAAKR